MASLVRCAAGMGFRPQGLLTFPTLPSSHQVKQLFKPAVNTVGKAYVGYVNSQLSNYGLRFDDLYDPLKDEVRGPVHACSSVPLSVVSYLSTASVAQLAGAPGPGS